MHSRPTEETTEKAPEKKDGHVAVIYVHGMGSQRRYEEASRLIDAIDIHLSNSQRRGEEKGYLARIRPRLEPSRSGAGRTEVYIRAKHHSPKEEGVEPTNARFFELYWAPIMAEHSSAWRVLVWLFGQVPRPLETIRAEWRERPRLRRSTLMEIFHEPDSWPPGTRERDFSELMGLYHRFERHDARRDFPKGTFKNFLKFQEKEIKSSQSQKKLLALSELWRQKYRYREATTAFLLVTFGLTLMALTGVAAALILYAFQKTYGWEVLKPLLGIMPDPISTRLNPSLAALFGVLFSIGGLLGIRKFLTLYLGDVESWSTYEETDAKHQRRKKVIDRGFRLLSHVLSDPDCTRAVIVSHSLGTAVAQDTLLEVARYNRAHYPSDPISKPIPLDKITHLITIASPIDKIQYFFESYKSRFHRYKRVVEDLRGDIGGVPFSRNRKPHIHWINFWDEGDIISGAIHSPTSRRGLPNRVDNVHISNLYFPDPGASHSAYFDNRQVIGEIFSIIFKGEHDFANAPRKPGSDYDLESVYLGPGDKTGRARFFALSAILFPWLLLLGLILSLLDMNTGVLVTWFLAASAFAILLVGFCVGKVRGHRLPL